MTSSPDMAGDPQPTSSRTSTSLVDDLLRDYHDARRREDQWRVPQLLLALATPLVAFISVLFTLAQQDAYGVISGAVTIVTATAAALIATQVWRWHRTAIGIANRIRDEHPGESALLLKDPL